MPCLWGNYNNSQALMQIAILPVDFHQKLKQGDTSVLEAGNQPPIFPALIDTGASTTCISKAVAERVNLNPIGTVPIQGVSGVKLHHNYLFHVGFITEQIVTKNKIQDMVQVEGQIHMIDKEIQGPELGPVSGPFEVLPGMDIISIGSLIIQGNGTFSFSF